MIHIIMTIDYEIFGNGRGDVKRHMIEPMNRLLGITNRYNVPLTIMFEVYEYIYFKKYDDRLRRDFGYSPAEIIQDQINTAYEHGHDIQLHIHPQFVKMRYIHKRFIPEIPELSVFDMNEQEVYNLIRRGKETLESMISANDYQCNALRLSNMGWVPAPVHVARAMERLGIVVHSLASMCAPIRTTGYQRIGDTRVYEIPIYTVPTKGYEYLKPRYLSTLAYVWLHSPPRIFKKSDKKLTSHKDHQNCRGIKWDLSKLSYKDMIKMLDYAIEHYDYENYEIPLVMIGHTKDFFNDKNLEKFIKTVLDEYKSTVRFSTFSKFITENLQR
ncbi:hypothetical protein CL1_0833 [Thermococcus cleftensis]|uniref:NodB homology domain-containing protein n=1 Tax=Thermococcus cleftensis (strain DSM 27260 / KACC 17922 / CL1) TaxID=163003 RepID=I3ZTK4_THECF|nr:hypothetical protein [Thermococcus cleftensis]AFL95038.1 hypothetical protein CL1_0833 [Thermococcus cleftensis]